MWPCVILMTTQNLSTGLKAKMLAVETQVWAWSAQCRSKKPQRSALQDLWDRKTTKTGILKMWQCELILEIVMCVMGMFYKQEFKRRNRRRAWSRRAAEHEALLGGFTVKPFNAAETHHSTQAIQESKADQSVGSAAEEEDGICYKHPGAWWPTTRHEYNLPKLETSICPSKPWR